METLPEVLVRVCQQRSFWSEYFYLTGHVLLDDLRAVGRVYTEWGLSQAFCWDKVHLKFIDDNVKELLAS